MAINFPSNPTNGDTIAVGGINYVYDSTQGVWSDSPQGLTQSIDKLTDVDTSTTAPANRQVLQWNSTDEKWKPADSGVQVYATIDDLPLSGVTEGAMALVDSTDKLYIFSDTGWYSIAIVNQTPSISGVNATYTLASDGTATTVTVTATDPEGIPITYSIVSDTSGNIATVAQGTGANTNQWTITPSTNEANAGSFTLVFRASDGTNIASASSTFELSFSIENSNYTTALITSVGANTAVNNSFDDASTNNHTVTASGNATQGTFSPYRRGGYSVYCDGNDAVKFNETASDEFTFGTGDFTLEGWFWIDLASIGASGEHTLIGNNGTDAELWFSVIGSQWGGPKYNFQTGTGSGWNTTVSSSANTVTLKEWVHLAVVRNSGTVTIYENGTSVASGSNTDNIPNTNSMLSFMGRPQTYGQYATGYIHDVRITKGEAVYTSSFTPPTETLTAGTNTKLLAFRKPYIVDESSSALSVTLDTGDPTVESFGPYDYATYASNDHGGSMYFDGTGDYLTIADSADLDMGSSDFTIEGWYYPHATASTNDGLISKRANSSESNGVLVYSNTTTGHFDLLVAQSGSWAINSRSSIAFKTNHWNHFAVVRNGTSFKLYVNGKAGVSVTSSVTIPDNNSAFAIGAMGADGSNTIPACNIADVRVVKGTAVYTSDFTPPTAPLTAITNTSLLLKGTDAGIIDKSQSVKAVILTGDAQSSSTQTKNSTTSIKFDGTGDKIEIPDFQLLRDGRDFTIEFWIYLTNTSAERNILETFSFSATTGWTIYHLSGGRLDFYPHHTNLTTLSATTWTHIAIENYGGTIKCFVNGTSTYSATHSTTSIPTAGLRIGTRSGTGNYFNGYMEDIRITDGYARYQGTNFTAPTEPLKG
jgi:hypothetical protein